MDPGLGGPPPAFMIMLPFVGTFIVVVLVALIVSLVRHPRVLRENGLDPLAARTPLARSVVLRQRGPAQYGPGEGGPLVIPAHGTLTLTPIGEDLVLQQPSPYESRATVPLTLTFRHSGTVTIDAPVTGPGTP